MSETTKTIDTANSVKTELKDQTRGLVPFAKGQSGNPSGRPKTPEAFKALARENSLDMLQIAIDIAKDTKAKNADRLKAVEIVTNRAWGLPTQAITGGTDEQGNDKAVNIETIVRLLGGQK